MEFKYKAKSTAGELLEGKVEAPSEREAVNILHERGYIILSINRLGGISSIDVMEFLNKPKNKDLAIFTRQLATLIDADMPILESLKILSQQTEKPQFKEIIENIAKSVESGSSLSGAFSGYPRIFSSFYLNLVRSGEASGKLHDSLLYLAGYLEKSQELNSKIKSALAYPIFILVSLIIVSFIMTVWVLPNLLKIFEDIGTSELPLTTKILIFTTNFVNKYFYIIIILALFLIGYFYYFLKTPEGRVWLDNLKIKMPYFGPIIKNFYVARISESFSTLIRAGVPIIDSLTITSNIVNNNNYKEILLKASESIKQGDPIGDSFKNYPEIPPLFYSMIAIGERTGKLSLMLEHVAKFYKTESENTIQGISQLIEPIMVLILGIAVAVLVSSILLPMYNLVGAI